MSLRFGIEFVPDEPVNQIVNWSKIAESVGFDNIWITDHFNNRNLWVTLTAIALNTSKVTIGPGVTNPFHTSPALSAAAIVTIDELTEGRTAVGLGAGDRMTLETLGIQWNLPVTTVIEGIQILRKLINGERVRFHGRVFDIRGAKLSHVKKEHQVDKDGKRILKDGKEVISGRRIPIYAGAQGPMMLKKTATLADGILTNASHPKDIEIAMKLIKEGVNQSGRDIKDLDIGAYTAFSIADSYQDALKGDTKMVVAFIVAGSPSSVLERHSLNFEQCDAVKNALSEKRYGDLDSLITDEMIDAFAIVGDKEFCINRIHEMEDVGVTHFIVGSPIGPDKRKAIEKIGKEIIPIFRERDYS
ncbi:MAG: 5,10-methylenetetrahydromethanopterin reductase [Candidatus Lokiarchaeota archaeon]|nr:5,10-methylenetetrahydromethanopterin reductase [Candidatus Lokiarchaeota archaeon]